MKNIIIFTLVSLTIASCESPEECIVNYGQRVPEDTLFYGRWVYKYSIARLTLWEYNPPIVADDTIFLGETRSWMSNGHPTSEVSIGKEKYIIYNVFNQSGESCVFNWDVDKAVTNNTSDSLILLALGNMSEDSDIKYNFGFVVRLDTKYQCFLHIWQDPYNSSSIFDGDPRVDTYDFYERVP